MFSCPNTRGWERECRGRYAKVIHYLSQLEACDLGGCQECSELLLAPDYGRRQLQGVELRQRLQQLSRALQAMKGCNYSGREQLVAALPAQLDAQGWHVQQAGLGEGAA
ncbi:hypothetical protein HaLaN_32140, partial [Haematococcus lacustris]